MRGEPPISEGEYEERSKTIPKKENKNLKGITSTSRPVRSQPMRPQPPRDLQADDDDSEAEDDDFDASACLFCRELSKSPGENVQHMRDEHGLYIPDVEDLSSLDSLINYLHYIIIRQKECIYCGAAKQSSEAVRGHMVDKGHCMLNLENEPELLEFWDLSDDDDADDEPSRFSSSKDEGEGEYTLPSGKVIATRAKARSTRLATRRINMTAKQISRPTIEPASASHADPTTSPAPDSSQSVSVNHASDSSAVSLAVAHMEQFHDPQDAPSQPEGRALAKREEAGMLGVTVHQKRALMRVEKKMQRKQELVNASQAWAQSADKLGGRSQKHGKVKMDLRSG